MTGHNQTALQAIQALAEGVEESVIGQENVVKRLIIALLANGNVLVEGLPGLAKTRSVKSIATVLEAEMNRIQFTPDLLPSDITGTEVLFEVGGKQEFRFQSGPIFANIVLADEINRAPAKVQAALLEAMEERQVTVAGKTHKMPDLFMVMATQNPIEQEGTYPLPEAQMDRFLMHVYIDYPDAESELKVIRLVRDESVSNKGNSDKRTIAQDSIFKAREEISRIHSSENIERYIVDLVHATRQPEKYSQELKKRIEVGASPRGCLALDKCSRVHAWLKGNEYVTPDDVRVVVHDCLRHRISLTYEANADGVSANDIITEIVKLVPVA